MPAAEALLDVDGPAAPPRSNGELAFNAPWERRVFGVTMALTLFSLNFLGDGLRDALDPQMRTF